MQKFSYDMFDQIEQPTFILSNIYHHHIGEINNINIDDVNVNINMNSADEMSFDVYKEVNGVKCNVWDDLVSFKYVYIPEHHEYYKADISIDEDNSTVKKVTLTSAAEHELSNRIIRSLEVNTESDILQDDYVTTVFYNEENPRGSLLHRVLSVKTPGWSIGHVDDTLCNIQRTFSISNQNIYQVLTDTIAKEIECLFLFDSVKRQISAYDLDNICLDCNYRGNFTDVCPKCGGTHIQKGYGKDANIFISYNNFSEKMTVDGDEGQVKNCFYVTGGDDNINAAIINCNPSGTPYIYRFSEADYADMPPALVAKLQEYSVYYDKNIKKYQEVVANWYDAINNYYYYKTSMMPRINGKPWKPETGYDLGDIVYVKTLPSWCYLECCEKGDPGRSGAEEFDATSVYEGQIIEDGTVQWIVRKNILTLPSARQIVEGGGVAWKANKTYVKDETVFTSKLPYNMSLKCEVPGKSGATEPIITDPHIGDTVTDGTVTWKVVQNEGDGLRQYFGNANNKVYFLNKLPESDTEIDNEIKNIASLQFNNIYRMEITDSTHSTDPITRTVTKTNTRWQNNKFYVKTGNNEELQKDQYIKYGNVYRYVDKSGIHQTGQDYQFYNESGEAGEWVLKQVNGDAYAIGFAIIDGKTYHFDRNTNHMDIGDFSDDGKRYKARYEGQYPDPPEKLGHIIYLRENHYNYIDIDPKWIETTTTSEVPTYTWTGNVKVYNTGDPDDTYTTTVPLTAYLYTTEVYEDYMAWMQEKVEKRLAKADSTVKSIIDIDIPRDDNGDYIQAVDDAVGSDPPSFSDILTQYSLDILETCAKAFTGTLEVMQNQGTGDKDKDFYGYDLYNPLYYPYYHRKELVDAEMKKRETTVKEWETKRDDYRTKMTEWQDKFNLEKFIGEDLYTVFFHYIREGDYNNPNYISDGISNGEVINYAKRVLELANEELNKATKLQFTLSDSLKNLLNTTEFKNYKERFAIGDYIVCECDEELYKLRLIGVSYNYGNPDSINVTFSNVTKVKNYFSDAQDILSKAQSMSTSYTATVHQVEKSSAITDEVDSWSEEGMPADVNKIVNNDVEEIMYDENGLIARSYDDITQTYSPKQLRIQNNKIVFTEDNWETTALAIGENTYKYWDPKGGDDKQGAWVTVEGYGVNAKFVNSGYITGSQIVAGEVYSENWNGTGTSGSYIDLVTGEFNFGGGGLTGKYNTATGKYELNYKGNAEVTADVGIGSEIGDWIVTEQGLGKEDSVITPSVVRTTTSVRSDKFYADTDIYINNQSLLSTLSSKQDTLVAGDNITIENNVISAVGGTEVIANPSEEPTAVLNTIKIGNIVYGIPSGDATTSTNARISTLSSTTSTGIEGRIEE